jgi:D-glycero-D-manno-heptose 1,7-bisphosphate phosphatase
MLSQVGGRVEAIMFCPHGPDDDCSCRKPKPGSFNELAHRLRTSVENVPAVGDSLRDIEAAITAGAKPILVRTGKGRATEKAGIPAGVAVYDDLASVVDALLEPTA